MEAKPNEETPTQYAMIMEAKPTRGDADGMVMEAKPTRGDAEGMIMEAKPTEQSIRWHDLEGGAEHPMA